MKKFNFFISAACIVCTSVLTSCFSSGGEMPEGWVDIGGYRVKIIDPERENKIDAICDVQGLEGYAIVSQETSRELVSDHVKGLLILLGRVKDGSIKKLDNPELVTSSKYSFPTSASVIKADCYPHEVSFRRPLDLTVVTPDADGMNFDFCFRDNENDKQNVSTDSEGLHTAIPHFSYWTFKMLINSIELVGTETIQSERMADECLIKDRDNVIVARYRAKYGFKAYTENPFVIEFLKQWVGEETEKQYEHQYWCREEPGTEFYHYEQPIYKLKLTSGDKEFMVDLYGTPTSKHDSFQTVGHNGGAGVNP